MTHEIHNLISVDEIKHFLRITSNIDDNLLKDLLETAVFHLEDYLSKGIINQIYEQVLIRSKEVLKYGPISQIYNVKTASGQDISYHLQDNIIEVSYQLEPVIVRYKGGLFSKQIPPEIKIAILNIVSSLYNSEPGKVSIDTILNQFRTIRNLKL
jgi:uncharacterized phiE125 gp8 family phage protein